MLPRKLRKVVCFLRGKPTNLLAKHGQRLRQLNPTPPPSLDLEQKPKRIEWDFFPTSGFLSGPRKGCFSGGGLDFPQSQVDPFASGFYPNFWRSTNGNGLETLLVLGGRLGENNSVRQNCWRSGLVSQAPWLFPSSVEPNCGVCGRLFSDVWDSVGAGFSVGCKFRVGVCSGRLCGF